MVVDGAGDPVEGATVTYWPESYGRTPDSFQKPGQAPAVRVTVHGTSLDSHRFGLGRVETDGEGRFTLRDVIPGTNSLFAVARGTTTVATLEGQHVNEGEEVDGVRIVAARADPPLLAGRVVDEVTGKPVNALIRVSADWVVIGRFQWCREDGSFLIGGLPASKVRLVVRAEGYKTTDFGPYSFEPDERRTGLELRLPPLPK